MITQLISADRSEKQRGRRTWEEYSRAVVPTSMRLKPPQPLIFNLGLETIQSEPGSSRYTDLPGRVYSVQ